MPATPPDKLRAALVDALRAAYRAGVGVPPELEARTRSYARAQHDASVPVEKVIIEIKELVRTETADHSMVFVPRVIGWAVAGYFQSAPRPNPA